MFELFSLGGILPMTFLTFILLALLLAAWKAPTWVKEIGIFALVAGVFAFLLNFYIAAGTIAKIGDISQSVLWGALRVSLITPMYGLIIYLVSLVIRIIQKPRI